VIKIQVVAVIVVTFRKSQLPDTKCSFDEHVKSLEQWTRTETPEEQKTDYEKKKEEPQRISDRANAFLDLPLKQHSRACSTRI